MDVMATDSTPADPQQGIQQRLVKFHLGAKTAARFAAMCEAQERTLSEVLRDLVGRALEDWAYKQPRLDPQPVVKKPGMGRPIDSDEAK